ncbi:MAG: hypothetical protein K2Y27_13760 [Xanthobacteraceae bacterium]|nr:hypothetical protein [Xanthobacteraceae bacterium]
MSSSDDRRPAVNADQSRANDAYGWIDRYAADLHRSAKELVEKGEAARVSDEAIAQIITAAVRLYYAKSELEERPVPAIVQEGAETLTATEMLVAVSEMLRDVGLGPMELGLWFRRRPGENDPGEHDSNHSGNIARSKP